MDLDTLLKGSWVKHPVPVLDVGEAGEWDDLMADCPSIFSQKKGEYFLFYTGHSKHSHRWAVGLAQSQDLFNWEKYRGNPILMSGGSGSWDQRIDGPAVIENQGKYYLFYEACSKFSFRQSRVATMFPYSLRKEIGVLRRRLLKLRSVSAPQVVEHAAGRAIGFAVSLDKINWTKFEKNPVLSAQGGESWDSCGVFSPCVQSIGDSFWLFYGGSDGKVVSSGFAVSRDLCNWQRQDAPILTVGIKGSWDDASALIISMIRLRDAYVVFYEGQDSNNRYAIGIAYSYDLKKWEKFSKNPILKSGPKGSLDERIINSPHVFQGEGELYIFHGSQDYKMQGRSSIASFLKP